MLLNYAFSMNEEAKLIEDAVALSIEQGYCTEDLLTEGGYSTSQVGDFIVSQMKSTVEA